VSSQDSFKLFELAYFPWSSAQKQHDKISCLIKTRQSDRNRIIKPMK